MLVRFYPQVGYTARGATMARTIYFINLLTHHPPLCYTNSGKLLSTIAMYTAVSNCLQFVVFC